MRRSRRRGLWIAGSIGLLVVAAGIAVRVLDEPARRYLEAEVNRRLSGYTVSIPGLRLHPLAAAIEMREATIVQNDNPDPPVLHVRRLVTSVDWRALIRGRVVIARRSSSAAGRRRSKPSRSISRSTGCASGRAT
jgi:uncharacterized protein involved in outer membrane biogenesis